jgi:hypothetical protein
MKKRSRYPSFLHFELDAYKQGFEGSKAEAGDVLQVSRTCWRIAVQGYAAILRKYAVSGQFVSRPREEESAQKRPTGWRMMLDSEFVTRRAIFNGLWKASLWEKSIPSQPTVEVAYRRRVRAWWCF